MSVFCNACILVAKLFKMADTIYYHISAQVSIWVEGGRGKGSGVVLERGTRGSHNSSLVMNTYSGQLLWGRFLFKGNRSNWIYLLFLSVGFSVATSLLLVSKKVVREENDGKGAFRSTAVVVEGCNFLVVTLRSWDKNEKIETRYIHCIIRTLSSLHAIIAL